MLSHRRPVQQRPKDIYWFSGRRLLLRTANGPRMFFRMDRALENHEGTCMQSAWPSKPCFRSCRRRHDACGMDPHRLGVTVRSSASTVRQRGDLMPRVFLRVSFGIRICSSAGAQEPGKQAASSEPIRSPIPYLQNCGDSYLHQSGGPFDLRAEYTASPAVCIPAEKGAARCLRCGRPAFLPWPSCRIMWSRQRPAADSAMTDPESPVRAQRCWPRAELWCPRRTWKCPRVQALRTNPRHLGCALMGSPGGGAA